MKKIYMGRVQFWKKTHGFVSPDDLDLPDVFVHYQAIINTTNSKFITLRENDRVSFELEETDKGFRGINVKIVEKAQVYDRPGIGQFKN